MILFNWERCIEGKINFARMNPTAEGVITKADQDAFVKIEDNFIDTYPPAGRYLEILQLRIDIAYAKADYLETGNKFNDNIIRIKQAMLDEKKKQIRPDTSDINKNLAILGKERASGLPINPKHITVKQYYDMIALFNESHKQVAA